jgi:hypothetical protein
MPIKLFVPFIEDVPEIAFGLQTIAGSESMGGVILKSHVRPVREAIQVEFDRMTRRSEDSIEVSAMQELLKALTHAETNGLSFTEAIE